MQLNVDVFFFEGIYKINTILKNKISMICSVRIVFGSCYS